MIYAVILAGGQGTNLWPASRYKQGKPKQCLPLTSSKPMVQEAVERLLPFIEPSNIYVESTHHLCGGMKEILPKDINFVLEPLPRDSAVAIGLCLISILDHDPEGIIFIDAADHHYDNDEIYRQYLSANYDFIEQGLIGLLGLKPTSPNPSFGYIKQGQLLQKEPFEVNQVVGFIEKPDKTTAEQLLASGEYFWNSGMLLFKAKSLLQVFKQHIPQLYQGLIEIWDAKFNTEVTKKVFESLDSVSIDYGLLEKAARENQLVVIPTEIEMIDVGHWSFLERIFSPDINGNVISDGVKNIVLDIKGCNIYSDNSTDMLVVTLGVDDLVIVLTSDALLVCHKSRINEVKNIVPLLDKKYT